jgi:hypothetical protein
MVQSNGPLCTSVLKSNYFENFWLYCLWLKNKSFTGFKISSGAYSVKKELLLSCILIGGQLFQLYQFSDTAQIYHTESNYDYDTVQSQLCEVVDYHLFKHEQKKLLEKLNRKTRIMPMKI